METNGRAVVVIPENVLFEAGLTGEGTRKQPPHRYPAPYMLSDNSMRSAP
jgi:hypothetical protein